jgi:hypothetical protein
MNSRSIIPNPNHDRIFCAATILVQAKKEQEKLQLNEAVRKLASI